MAFQSSSDEAILFRKTAMVLHELEKALGDFVRKMLREVEDLSSASLRSIQEDNRRLPKELTVSGIVGATYLSEVLDWAQETSKGRSEEPHFRRLKELFKLLDVSGIRNAISHPNREFHPSYWYRIATIAADPVIDKLSFKQVIGALRAAELGQIMLPPEEWMSRSIWSIANNLPKPEQFEHNITRFIGRIREISELKRFLSKRGCRLIAIVAPGGLGKTALLLEVLAKEVIHSPEASEWVDRILYFSSKTEKLTADGVIETIPTTRTIEDIQNSIAQVLAEQEGLDSLTFEEACEQFRAQRILLCLDNLETILKDNQQVFKDFYWELPSEWRVIVTSRIRVEEATSITLEPMAESHALHLAREYLSKRGGEKLNEDDLKKLAQTCDLVPLAIRLAVDSFIAGQSIDKAQTVAKERILEFSYNNLIEVLSDASRALLECLFVTSPEPINRPLASLLLQRNDDEMAEAFGQLRGTSLVTKIPDQLEESYTLSLSVRELLRLRPIDQSIRRAVQKQRSKMKEQIQNSGEQGTNPLSKTHIPDNAPDAVKFKSTEAFRELKRNFDAHRLNKALKSIEQTIEFYRDQPVLHRAKGQILLRLMDRSEGIRALKQAWAIEPCDVASGLHLSYELREDHEYAEAKEVAQKLMDLGWYDPQKSDVYHAGLVLKNYWLPLIWLGETDQVIEETEDWQKVSKDLRGIYGVMRAQALRESIETVQSIRSAAIPLRNATEILDTLLRSEEGYAGLYVDEGIKLVRTLSKTVSRRSGFSTKSPTRKKNELSEETKQQFVSFVNDHLKQMCGIHEKYKLDHPDVRTWLRVLSNISLKEGSNPLASAPWNDILGLADLPEEEEFEPGANWLKVKIYYRPYRKPFLFARDEASKQQYIVHKKNLGSSGKYWESIKEGDYLEIQPGILENDQPAIKANKARVRKKII